MKQVFNTMGVAQVQAAILALPASELDAQLQSIRNNFTGWMMSQFDLSPAQQTQLSQMPSAFKQELANSVADTWQSGSLVNFQSDDKEEDDRRGKDIIFFPRPRKAWNVNSGTVDEQIGLEIWIHYRD